MLLGLLALSFVLRGALALSGGQRFFPDENRYLRCFILLRHLERADLRGALDEVLVNPDHTGFLAVGLVPATVQRLALKALGMPQARPTVDATAWLPALILSLCSVACIGLVGSIARRAGGSDAEGLLAALLMACSTVMLFYSRHLLPYDAALALALFAVYLGLVEHASWRRSLLVGLVAGSAFLTYNGYWLVALAALALHCFYGAPPLRQVLRRGATAGLGFTALPALLTASSLARGKGLYVRRLLRFSRGAATQADFSEGWSLPWEYLWHAEHLLLIVLAAGAAAVLWLAARRDGAARSRGLLFLGAAAGMYAVMVVGSIGFERIGTFGRLSRSLVPFLCLATACAGARWITARRSVAWAALLALAAQAGFNFATPLRQRFPREVARELEVAFGELGRDTSVRVDQSPEEKPLTDERHVLLNARYLYPVYGPKPAPEGRVLFRTPHPQEYLPYQYEGLVPGERALLRSTDVSMRLIDTRPDGAR